MFAFARCSSSCCPDRDDITLGPILGEISSHQNSSSSSSISAAGAEMPAERTYQESYPCVPLLTCPTCWSGTTTSTLASLWSSSAIQDVPPLNHWLWGPTMAHSEKGGYICKDFSAWLNSVSYRVNSRSFVNSSQFSERVSRHFLFYIYLRSV